MKKFRLEVPISSVNITGKQENYFNWLWTLAEEMTHFFSEGIKSDFGFSYLEYGECMEEENENAIWFRENSSEYFVHFLFDTESNDILYFDLSVGTFEYKKFLFLERRYETNIHLPMLEKSILKTAKMRGLRISKPTDNLNLD